MKMRRQAYIDNINRRIGKNPAQIGGAAGTVGIGEMTSPRLVKIADAVD